MVEPRTCGELVMRSGFPGGSSSAPFKNGGAVLTAQVNTDSDLVAAGPQPIRLTK